MSDVVERVARALARKAWHDPAVEDESQIAASVDHEWQEWVEEAKAAIAAMREPTMAMIEEAAAEGFCREEDAKPIYQAMIDAALGATASDAEATGGRRDHAGDQPPGA